MMARLGFMRYCVPVVFLVSACSYFSEPEAAPPPALWESLTYLTVRSVEEDGYTHYTFAAGEGAEALNARRGSLIDIELSLPTRRDPLAEETVFTVGNVLSENVVSYVRIATNQRVDRLRSISGASYNADLVAGYGGRNGALSSSQERTFAARAVAIVAGTITARRSGTVYKLVFDLLPYGGERFRGTLLLADDSP